MTATAEKDQQDQQDEQPTKPLIDLSETSKRQTCKLRDGSLHELKNLGEFGAVEGQAVRRDGREFRELWDLEDELTQDQQDRLRMLVDRLFEKVIDAPKTVKMRVKDGDRAQIVLGFTGTSAETQLEALQAMLAAMARQDQ